MYVIAFETNVFFFLICLSGRNSKSSARRHKDKILRHKCKKINLSNQKGNTEREREREREREESNAEHPDAGFHILELPKRQKGFITPKILT